MKLLELNIIDGGDYGLLTGFKQIFRIQNSNNSSPICLAGSNGSGKSKLLEFLAEIFYDLDRMITWEDKVKTKSKYTIGYYLHNIKTYVLITQDKSQFSPVFQISKDNIIWVSPNNELSQYLPKQIVGYCSGENESLSRVFINSYERYSKAVTGWELNPLAKEDEEIRLLFADYSMNQLLFVANNIFRSDKELKQLHSEVKNFHSIESFRIAIQLNPNHNAAPIRLTSELNDFYGKLQRCATTSFYDEKRDKWVLDFYINDAAKELFKIHFKDSFNFYNSLFKLELLNEILTKREKERIKREAEYPNQKLEFPVLSSEDKVFQIENVRINLKSGVEIGYFDLSDGEHQLIHVLGLLIMIDEKDVLFLLDEPETHFNPQWRSKFISKIENFKGLKDQEVLITTHSPFIIGDCKKENVLIFKNGKSRNPDIQTYGLSMDRLMQEIFEVTPPLAEKSLKEIRKLIATNDLEKLSNRIDDFGDSVEKIYLFQRIAELEREKKK